MYLQTKKDKERGFSIVEVLVYMGLLVLISSALVSTFISLGSTIIRNKTDRELTQSAQVSLERINQALRRADAVHMGLSVLNSSSSVLVLTEGTTTTQFRISASNLELLVNGVTIGPLTSDNVTVQSFVARRFTASTTELVRVALTLSASSKASSITRTFYTSGVLRGSYDY